MEPAPVVEVHPPADAGPGLGAGRELSQVDALVLERSPQSRRQEPVAREQKKGSEICRDMPGYAGI